MTVLTIPFANAFFAAFYCNSEDEIHGGLECYAGIYWLHLILAVLGFMLYLLLCTLYSLLYADINPNSTIPFASPQTRIGLLKFILKLALPLYTVLDYKVRSLSSH